MRKNWMGLVVACGLSPIVGLGSCYRTPRDSWERASFSFCSTECSKNLGPGCEVSLGKLRVIEQGGVSARVCSAALWRHPVYHVLPSLMGFTWLRWAAPWHVSRRDCVSFIGISHLPLCAVLLRGPKSMFLCLSLDNVTDVSSLYLDGIDFLPSSRSVFSNSIYHNSLLGC